MDPSAQNVANLMQQQQANSSQLGGGANGDHSKLNGDQAILNPLSTQMRDQQQAEMAAQIAAKNKAEAMLAAQTKQAQQVQQKLAQNSNPPAAASAPAANSSPAAPGTIQSPASQPQAPQPVKPSGTIPGTMQSPTSPGVSPNTIQNPPTPATPLPVANQNPVPQNSSPQPQQMPGTIQTPAPQPVQNSVPPAQQPSAPMLGTAQNLVSQPQPMQQPGTIQNPVSQSPAPQVAQPQQPQVQPGFPGQSTQNQPGMQQQPIQNQQMIQPVQNQMQQGGIAPQGVVPGTIQNPAAQQPQMPGVIQNQAPQQMQQIPQTQPVQFVQQGAPMPGMIQNQAPQGSGTQPVSFQNQQAVPQTAPVSFQTFATPQPQQVPQGQQDPNAAQPADPNQSTLSVQQAIADTFIPVTQLISSNHDPIQDLHHTVASSNVPDELRVILNDRIKRLGLIKEGAGLSSMYILELESTTRYINACVGLPWVTKTEDTLDLAKAKEILDRHHYGLDLLKNRMLEFIASIMLNLKNNGPDYASRSPILCFVGLAGTGKTTFAKSMAEALGRKFERVPFGGMADSRVLRGQSRFFPDAEPGQFMKCLTRAQSKNPVLLLDEVDRVTETARADIMGVLIEALDPEQNAQFTDHYIDYPFSLQNCLFVATSNNISTIATAVLDRMEIIQMPNYNDAEKKVIGRDYVLPKVRAQMGLREDQIIIDDGVWDAIIRPLGYDPGVRALDRIIGMICRRAARMIVAGEAENVRVTVNNMKPFVQDF